MKYVYPVIITQKEDKEGAVLARVAGLNISSEAHSIKEAVEQVREAIGRYVATLEKMGGELPLPLSMQEVNWEEREDEISCVSFVDVDFGKDRERGEQETYFMGVEQSLMVKEAAVSYKAWRGKRQGEYTVEDVYELPDDVRVELIDGVIYDMSAPSVVHQVAIGRMHTIIANFIQKKGGSCIPLMSPVDVRLDCDDKTMVQPDLIILCDKSKIMERGVMGAPEFVLEVLSKSTQKKDCTKKLQKYMDAGVKEYWILDPRKKMLVTYDFINDEMPGIHPLSEKVGIALYNGELVIDLNEIAELIQEWSGEARD